jgi:hypothetical protein
MEMLQMLLEDTEKNSLIGVCQIVLLSFLLAPNYERQEHITKCNGMLAMRVLYIIYGWKSGSPKVVKDS